MNVPERGLNLANSYSWERPKLKIPKTKSEWFLDIIGYSFYIGSIIFLIMIWGKLPEEVPGHYNEFGEVTRWLSKWKLIVLPVIGAFLLLILQTLERFPEVYNYPKKFNQTNAKQFYLTGRKVINQLKNICLVIFALSLFGDVSISLGWSSSLGKAFLPITMISFAIPIVIGIIKFKKIS